MTPDNKKVLPEGIRPIDIAQSLEGHLPPEVCDEIGIQWYTSVAHQMAYRALLDIRKDPEELLRL